ncbi:DUF4439 domain-containing protein [Blastococcus saxobsidens]|uniref:DUF4439 domain-containing protein n=1 Tax=Blastococcus saxobsidens TaxID=138336 RepID=A0A6L9W4G0_9ACTN|nr:DUF4439 domain-containing protein [Blastococcus saxobsidens]NEK86923.1 DUF4439 domain-containing protein [Blastococcus saxobsidens]
MADDTADVPADDAALNAALAAEHAAIWGYGVVGAALGAGQAAVLAAEIAHRDVRDRVTTLLADRGTEPVPPEGGYALPFPVLSAVDAAALAVVLEEGVSAAWVRVLDRTAERSTRELAAEVLGAAEVRAVGWRAAAAQNPTTRAFPGL